MAELNCQTHPCLLIRFNWITSAVQATSDRRTDYHIRDKVLFSLVNVLLYSYCDMPKNAVTDTATRTLIKLNSQIVQFCIIKDFTKIMTKKQTTCSMVISLLFDIFSNKTNYFLYYITLQDCCIVDLMIDWATYHENIYFLLRAVANISKEHNNVEKYLGT